VFLLFHNK